MSAFSGLKMVTQTNQTNQSKFTATLSLEEQVLHSSLIPEFQYEKDQDPVVRFGAQDLEEKFYCDNVLTGANRDEVLPEELQQQYNQMAKEVEAASTFVTSCYFVQYDPKLTFFCNCRNLLF